MARFLSTTLIFSVACCALRSESADSVYRKQIEQYREKREAALKADGGWLTVTGLFWLKQGNNSLGSDTANDIVLPGSSPAQFGTIKLDHGTAIFATSSPSVKLNGQPVHEATLRYANPPDTLSTGPLD